MEALTKNKEEIEKINESCGGGFGGKRTDHGLFYYSCNGKKGLCPTCKTRIKTYLTTMIKCYEEEIEFLIWVKKFLYEEEIETFPIPILERIEELTQKINYLKEKLEQIK